MTGLRVRKKPVEVRAVRVRAVLHWRPLDMCKLPVWFLEAHDSGVVRFEKDGLVVRTLEGEMRAEAADYIICGIKGELYPCKPDVFDATYEVIT